MRVAVAVVAILALGSVAASAQKLEFGAKAGPSFGMLAFEPDESDDYDRRAAADGGGFVVLPFAPRLALQLEGLFTSKGAKLYDPGQDATGAILLQYFDLPVLVRLQGPRSLHFFGGPFAGIRLSAKRSVSSLRSGVKGDMSDEVERVEAGLLAGAGVNLGRYVVIDGRYVRGLTALNTDRSGGLRVRNRGISFMAGVRF
jgi:hypothetical protein